MCKIPPARAPFLEVAISLIDDVGVGRAPAHGLQVAGAGLHSMEGVDLVPDAGLLQGVGVVAWQAPRGSARAMHIEILMACPDTSWFCRDDLS